MHLGKCSRMHSFQMDPRYFAGLYGHVWFQGIDKSRLPGSRMPENRLILSFRACFSIPVFVFFRLKQNNTCTRLFRKSLSVLAEGSPVPIINIDLVKNQACRNIISPGCDKKPVDKPGGMSLVLQESQWERHGQGLQLWYGTPWIISLPSWWCNCPGLIAVMIPLPCCISCSRLTLSPIATGLVCLISWIRNCPFNRQSMTEPSSSRTLIQLPVDFMTRPSNYSGKIITLLTWWSA